jgi:methionine synthase II (cobalamin-independent)
MQAGAGARATRLQSFADGLSVGVGSLPHSDATAAAAFAIGEFDVATIPNLPNRSDGESMLAQAVAGVGGVTAAPDGTALVLSHGTTPSLGPIPIAGEAFTGLRAFLDLARVIRFDGAPVKWQFVGPVTVGCALARAGMPIDEAFALSGAIVRSRLTELTRTVSATAPGSPQLVVLDEPVLVGLMHADFPVPPDHAIDLMSSAMAALPHDVATGIHCCAPTDLSALLSAGPDVVSVPARADVAGWAGSLARFLEEGGHVAWGVVPTSGPVPSSVDRPWRALSDLWCALVRHGCDAVMLRRQSVVSPECGLAGHSVSVARRIARLASGVGRRVNEQSTATRMALGA